MEMLAGLQHEDGAGLAFETWESDTSAAAMGGSHPILILNGSRLTPPLLRSISSIFNILCSLPKAEGNAIGRDRTPYAQVSAGLLSSIERMICEQLLRAEESGEGATSQVVEKANVARRGGGGGLWSSQVE